MAGSENPFEFLKITNDWLEDVPITAIQGLNNSITKANQTVQSKVDAICAWISWKINIEVERVRQACVRALHNMYQNTVLGKVMQLANTLNNFVKDPIGTLFKFASDLFGPVPKVFRWLGELIREIPRLAENLAKIANSLPPPSINPKINYNKFKIKVKTISLQEIISGTENTPPPEEVFPEPPKPFSKETFDDVFTNFSAQLKSNKLVYKLTARQKESLKALTTNSNPDSLSFISSNDIDSLSFNS